MKRYLNWYKIYSLPVWKLRVIDYLLSIIIFHQHNMRALKAHWVNRPHLMYPEKAKLTLYLFGYRLILWLSVDRQKAKA